MNFTKTLADMILVQNNPRGAAQTLLQKHDEGDEDFMTRRSQAMICINPALEITSYDASFCLTARSFCPDIVVSS